MGESNNRRASTIVIALLLLVGLVTIGFVGYMFGKSNSSGSPPSSHLSIIKQLSAFDSTINTQLSVTFIDSSEPFLYEEYPEATGLINVNGTMISQNLFDSYNASYKISEWKWDVEGDPQIYMNVWGAGDDGKTYCVEFCSISEHSFQVNSPLGNFILSPSNSRNVLTMKLL